MAKLAKIKTTETDASVDDFVNKITDEEKRKDTQVIINMMAKASKAKPKMWGPAIIGFGNKVYVSPTSGREVDWMRIGFSPRKANLSLYLLSGLQNHSEALNKLGKYTTGVGCLYIKRLADVDVKILEKMIQQEMK